MSELTALLLLLLFILSCLTQNCDDNTERQGDVCQWETGGMFRFQRGGVALAPQAPKTNSLGTQEGHALVSTMNASQQIDKKWNNEAILKY